MSLAADEGSSFFLSTTPATRRDRTIALSIAGVSLLLFAAAVPFAGVPLAPIPPFVASYQSALAINDIITAILLFSQFSVLRSRALLFLASGYLFTAGAAIVHALTFPGLFSPTGLLGSGPQTTVWLFMIWHAGFPILRKIPPADQGSRAPLPQPFLQAALRSASRWRDWSGSPPEGMTCFRSC